MFESLQQGLEAWILPLAGWISEPRRSLSPCRISSPFRGQFHIYRTENGSLKSCNAGNVLHIRQPGKWRALLDDRLHRGNRCSSLILLSGAFLNLGYCTVANRDINEVDERAGEGSELMHGVLRGPKRAYFGCFSPSSPDIFRSFLLLPWKGNDFCF